MRKALLILFILAFNNSAIATDGVLEINQTCATLMGCFPGDSAGYPVTIDGSAGRSYRLTSDLLTPNENTDGISINTSDIAIDLNGFTIIRQTCQGVGHVNCTPNSGTGSGIEVVNLSEHRGISVKNGAVTGTGEYGIILGLHSIVTNVRLRWNRLDGIAVRPGSVVTGNTTYQNGRDGISAHDGSIVSGNTAYQNGDDGIVSGSGSTVFGNSAFQNGADGIFCSTGCLVKENTMRDNARYGLTIGTDSSYSDNVVSNNTMGTITGAGSANIRGGNYCAGTGTGSAFCP